MKSMQYVLILFLSIISAFLGGTFGVWFLMPPSVLAQDGPQKVIEAQEFRVVDAEGQVKVLLNVLEDGNANVVLLGDTPALSFWDQSLNDRLMIGIFPDQKPGLIISDKEGNKRLTLGVGGEGAPFLTLQDKEGDKSLKLNVGVNVKSLIADGLEAAVYGREPKSEEEFVEPHLILADGEFFTEMTSSSVEIFNVGSAGGSAELSIVPEDGPSLKIEGQGGSAVLGKTELKNNRTGSTEIRAPSSLVLFDEEGKVVWSAP